MARMARQAAKVMTPISVFDSTAKVRETTAVLFRNQRPLSRSPRSRGFTLLELLLVLAIVAMASLVVFPNIGGLETRTFNARVREAHTLLNLARRTAVVSGQPSIASFSVVPADEEEQPVLSSFSVGRWDGSGIELTFEDSADQ